MTIEDYANDIVIGVGKWWKIQRWTMIITIIVLTVMKTYTLLKHAKN